MAQVFDPVPSDHPSHILCCYINATSKIQIARITNIENWYFERVVFPGQRLMFEALASAMLEIHSGAMASAILSDTIPCRRLKVSAEGQEAADSNSGSQPDDKTAQSTAAAEAQSSSFRDGLAAAAGSRKNNTPRYQPV
ncbi:MAG: DUF1830 domain-containing protein [Elainellaceae cyanobacterium]